MCAPLRGKSRESRAALKIRCVLLYILYVRTAPSSSRHQRERARERERITRRVARRHRRAAPTFAKLFIYVSVKVYRPLPRGAFVIFSLSVSVSFTLQQCVCRPLRARKE